MKIVPPRRRTAIRRNLLVTAALVALLWSAQASAQTPAEAEHAGEPALLAQDGEQEGSARPAAPNQARRLTPDSRPATERLGEAGQRALEEARQAETANPDPGDSETPSDGADDANAATAPVTTQATTFVPPDSARRVTSADIQRANLPVPARLMEFTPAPPGDDERSTIERSIDSAFSNVVGVMATVLFFDVIPGPLRQRLTPDASLDILLVHRDDFAFWTNATLPSDIRLDLGRPLATERAALDAWLDTLSPPEGAAFATGPETTYAEGMGDRTVSGYRAYLVDTEYAWPGALVASVELHREEGDDRVSLQLGFNTQEDNWQDFRSTAAARPGADLAFRVNGDVVLAPRIGEAFASEHALITIARDVSDERHFREMRDLRTTISAELLPGPRAPFIVVWLILGAVFFTIRMGFVNIRAFGHALDVVRGKYDDPEDKGEVSHFQALASALSATVGLGNIAGVAIAIAIGGAGAVFWMLVAAFFGMTSKFVECTLGQKYRSVDERGKVLGGPMMYLHFGLKEKGLGGLGRTLAIVFMIFCIGGSFGGGNMFQANQAYQAMNGILPFHLSASLFGLILIVAVGIVIIGGIRRIGRAAAAIVPAMCAIYLAATVFVLIIHFQHIPYALMHIVGSAFSDSALHGGIVGVLIIGFQRAAFSNEAGIGSAAIAHSAARTNQPVREGVVALLEPFIDTMVVCLATGLVIVVSGVLDTPQGAELAGNGALLTSAAFGSAISWFPIVLAFAIVLFAYSTMLAWSYYGERCWTGLFGNRSSTAYKVIFLIFIWVGCVANLGSVVDFSDLMILSMAFPNILGLFLLSSSVRADLKAYLDNLKAGKFKRHE